MGLSRRLQLHSSLVALLGSENVYFQPPATLQMQYPCIVYERDAASANHADNMPYTVVQGYQVTYISRMPDDDVVDKLMVYPSSRYQRHFATSGLNHDVFVIYH